MAKSRLAGLLALVAICGCATDRSPYPVLQEAKATESVVVARLLRAISHQQFSECEPNQEGDVIVLCLDPPPFRVALQIEETLFGPRLSRRAFASTTSHYGRQTYQYGEDRLYLVKILSDGDVNIIPRYAVEKLAIDKREELALPVAAPSDVPAWLPCDVMSLVKPRDLVSPRDAIIVDAYRYNADELSTPSEFWMPAGDQIRIAAGVSTSDLRQFLSRLDHQKLAPCEY